MRSLLIFSIILAGCGQDAVLQGPVGPMGSPGLNGQGCSVAALAVGPASPNGGSLITCPDGSSSVVLNGSNGANGAPGTPGTVVTPVQFCPGHQSYPGTFTESGICIAGVLYGVYSLNGGFLAELPPGVYSSDGINSSCTFTIHANCLVTH